MFLTKVLKKKKKKVGFQLSVGIMEKLAGARYFIIQFSQQV